jgi:hypothetical protein
MLEVVKPDRGKSELFQKRAPDPPIEVAVTEAVIDLVRERRFLGSASLDVPTKNRGVFLIENDETRRVLGLGRAQSVADLGFLECLMHEKAKRWFVEVKVADVQTEEFFGASLREKRKVKQRIETMEPDSVEESEDVFGLPRRLL